MTRHIALGNGGLLVKTDIGGMARIKSKEELRKRWK